MRAEEMRTVKKTDLDGGTPDQARPDTRPDLADHLQERAGGLAPDFGALVAAEIPGLYRYALSLAGNRAEAEDVVGDTVLRALERQDQFRGEASLRTWLHQILHRLAIDRGRRHGREMTVAGVEGTWRDERYSVDAAVVADRAQIRAELRDSLLHLPFGYRAVVVLHDAEGWPAAEIAQALGIGLPAARQRLRRGRMMLVTALAQGQERRTAGKQVPLSCWDARSRVSDYIDGELAAGQRVPLEAHLAACATCPPLYQALVGATASLGALHDPDSVVPPELARRIKDRAPRP
jgi:RNA polymerase sigma-70 factor (ECF subfamily)